MKENMHKLIEQIKVETFCLCFCDIKKVASRSERILNSNEEIVGVRNMFKMAFRNLARNKKRTF